MVNTAPTAEHGWTVTKMHDDLTVDLHQCRTCGHYKALNGYTKEKACNCLLETGHRREMDEGGQCLSWVKKERRGKKVWPMDQYDGSTWDGYEKRR